MLTEWESGENAQDFLEVGKQLQSSGRYQEALTWYQRVTWLEPSWGSPWYYIGLTLEKLEDTEGALSAYERSVQLSPHNIEPYYALGDLLTNRLKDYNKALEVYQVVSKLDPLPIQAYIDIGDTLEKIGQKEQSLLAYQEAVRQSEQINGNSNVDYRNRVWPLYILGDYYLRMGSLEDATNYFHQALAKDPNQWFAGWSLWGLGRIELQKERFDEAGSELFQALELASNFYLRSQIYLNIGEVYINQGKIDIGIEYLRKAHIEHPDNRGLHLFLAETLRDAGYLKEAILEYENYLKKWPDDNNALHALQETQDMLATQHP
jgi:tetratricopeptide (TPR) repeat protein